VLPIGMTMKANAVISADRRYVRITALPFFSTIKGVVQYNMQSGVTDQAESDEAFQNLDINIDQDGGQDGDADGGNAGGFVLTISVPTPPTVGGLPEPGAVSRTGPTNEPLAVQITPPPGTVATLTPADGAVVIPTGQASAIFFVTAVSSGNVILQARADGQSATTSFTIP
jgi:hypothetical protein